MRTASLQRIPAWMLLFEIKPSSWASEKNVPWVMRACSVFPLMG